MQVFLCTDLWKDAATLHAAYCDSKGVTEAFIKNGMLHALHALGVGAQAKPECWEYDVVINPVDRRVSHQQAFSTPMHTCSFDQCAIFSAYHRPSTFWLSVCQLRLLVL